jgi:hypothetical protein
MDAADAMENDSLEIQKRKHDFTREEFYHNVEAAARAVRERHPEADPTGTLADNPIFLLAIHQSMKRKANPRIGLRFAMRENPIFREILRQGGASAVDIAAGLRGTQLATVKDVPALGSKELHPALKGCVIVLAIFGGLIQMVQIVTSVMIANASAPGGAAFDPLKIIMVFVHPITLFTLACMGWLSYKTYRSIQPGRESLALSGACQRSAMILLRLPGLFDRKMARRYVAQLESGCSTALILGLAFFGFVVVGIFISVALVWLGDEFILVGQIWVWVPAVLAVIYLGSKIAEQNASKSFGLLAEVVAEARRAAETEPEIAF